MKTVVFFLLALVSLFPDGLDEKIAHPEALFTDARRTWIGRPIYFLPRPHTPDENPFFDFCSDPRNLRDTRIPYSRLAGKTGRFVEVWAAHITYHDWQRVFHYVQGYFWKVRLDSSKQIVWYWDDNRTGVMNFGFLDDFRAARRHIGDTLYVKREPCLYGLDDSTLIPLRNTEPVIIRDVRWGEFGNCPIQIILETRSGRRGYLWAWTIDKFLRNWYRTDPRRHFRTWPPKFWRYVLYRRLIPGMSEEMVRLSWGEPVRRDTLKRAHSVPIVRWIFPGVREIEYRLYFKKHKLVQWDWKSCPGTSTDIRLKPLHLEENP